MPRARTRPYDDAGVPASAWTRAQQIAARSGLVPHVRLAINKPTGAPRVLTPEALLVGLLAHGILQRSGLLTDVARTFAALNTSQRHAVGLSRPVTHRMVDHAIDKLLKALAEDGATTSPNEFNNQLLAGSLPAGYDQHAHCVAIDSTDYETFARRRSWASRIDADPDALPVEEPKTGRPRFTNEPGWPRIGADKRRQHTVDPDARDGYRSGHNAQPGGVFCGYDLHLAVTCPDRHGQTAPLAILGMALDPAGDHKGRAGIGLIDTLRKPSNPAIPQKISEVLADRGYSYCKPHTWIQPLWARGIEPISDLHKNQRGTRPGPITGTVLIDGAIYSDAIPDHLRDLPGFPLGMRKRAKAQLHEQYDQRAQWAFTPHGKRQATGRQRLKGPAVDRRVRCCNYPPSMRLPLDRPTTSCQPGVPCACGRTVTIDRDFYPGTQQRLVWGGTTWAQSYHRRNRVESANAELKHHRQAFRRGFTRVVGKTKTALLIAFAIVGVNAALTTRETDTAQEPASNAPIPTARRRNGHTYRRRRERPAPANRK